MAATVAGPRRDLAVSGHVNVDRFLSVDRFPAPDRTEPVRGARVALGGTATNVALVAAAHGVRVGLIARIGVGFPPDFRRRLVRARIDLGGLRTVPSRRTPECYIVEDRDGHQRTMIDQGAMDSGVDATVSRSWLGRFAWLHVGTGAPTDQLALASTARSLGLRVAADPAQEIFYGWSGRELRRLLAESEILFGNAAELDHAARLTGVRGPRGLLERVPLVVRTEGPRGATAFARSGAVHVPAVRPRRRRTFVGAGDAFRGGFYGAFFRGAPTPTCLAAGTTAAARWIAGPG